MWQKDTFLTNLSLFSALPSKCVCALLQQSCVTFLATIRSPPPATVPKPEKARNKIVCLFRLQQKATRGCKEINFPGSWELSNWNVKTDKPCDGTWLYVTFVAAGESVVDVWRIPIKNITRGNALFPDSTQHNFSGPACSLTAWPQGRSSTLNYWCFTDVLTKPVKKLSCSVICQD